jgi:hypothetical protein
MMREWPSIHREALAENWERLQGVDGDFGTISWPGEIDLDPDVLRGDRPPAFGRAMPRRVIQPA